MFNPTLPVIAALMGWATAQYTIGPNGTITCSQAGSFCAGDSLKTNIIIRCDETGHGYAGNCNDELAGVPPVGVKDFAPCYESSPTAGDAVCTYNCLEGSFTIPSCTPTPVPTQLSPRNHIPNHQPLVKKQLLSAASSGAAAASGTGTGITANQTTRASSAGTGRPAGPSKTSTSTPISGAQAAVSGIVNEMMGLALLAFLTSLFF